MQTFDQIFQKFHEGNMMVRESDTVILFLQLAKTFFKRPQVRLKISKLEPENVYVVQLGSLNLCRDDNCWIQGWFTGSSSDFAQRSDSYRVLAKIIAAPLGTSCVLINSRKLYQLQLCMQVDTKWNGNFRSEKHNSG